MSGRPYTYGRGMAIAQLMRDMRRPVLANDFTAFERLGERLG